MNRFFSQRYSVFASIAGVIFISILGYVTLKDTLALALIGDDWLLLYTIRQIFDIQKSQNFFQLGSYLCTYCPHYPLLSLVKHFWGYNPYYYYLVSMVVRIASALALFFGTYALTKKKLMALVVGGLWVTTYQGIQSSDWVFNFNHYAGIGIVAIFVTLYIKLQNAFSIKKLAICALLFCFAVIVSPPRMHGLVPFVFIIELSWLVIQGKQYGWKLGLIRIATILLAYKLLFVLAKGGYGTSEYNLNQIQHGFMEMQALWAKGQTAFLTYPVGSLGNYLLPDISWTAIQKTNILGLGAGLNSFKQLIVPISICTTLFFLILSRLIGVGKKIWKMFFLGQAVWMMIIYWIVRQNRTTFSKENIVFALVGGAFILFTILAGWTLRKTQTLYSRLLFVSLGWMVAFSVLPWILAPYAPLPTWMRYSVQQGAGLALWMGVVFALVVEKVPTGSKRRFMAIGVFVALILFQISNTHSYIQTLSAHRSEVMVQPLWDTLHKDLGQLPRDRLTVVYLTYDDYYLAEWGLRFGFSSRAFIEFGLDKPGTTPIMVLDYPELVSFVTDGKEFAKHGFPLKPIPLTDVYAFELKNGKLINKTDEVRSVLKKLLAKTPF